MAALLAIAITSLGHAAAGPAADQSRGDQHRLDETEMLERARAERPAHQAIEAPATSAAQRTENDVDDAAEDPARAERRRQREAELDEVSARLRASASRRPAAAPPGRPLDLDEHASAESAPPFAGRGHATILLALEPGHRGIRRLAPTADPVLCLADVCYVSQGVDADALMLPRRRALGPLNTIGGRAGACNDSTICVFRNVAIGPAAAIVQPVDLRLLRHDRREARPAQIDHTCHAMAGRLTCAAATSGPDYSLWIVPEAVARQAGASALATAAAGLPLR